MLNQQTLDKLKELKLHGLAAAWAEQQTLTDYAGLGFDERLGLLVDAEWLTRNNARLKRNVKEAHLKLDSACLEDLELALARADGTYARLLARLARVDVLVLDDWGMAPLSPAERRDMSELMEDRYGEHSTILRRYVFRTFSEFFHVIRDAAVPVDGRDAGHE